MSALKDTAPAVVVRLGRDGATPYYEAKWRHDGKQVKRRLGRAWLDRDGDGWKKRRGRTPDGWLDPRTVHVAAAQAVEQHQEEAVERQRDAERAKLVTVRRLAFEWLDWLRDVKGASPATIRDYRALLREPGEKYQRGDGEAPGRIMKAFGDKVAADVTPKDVSAWLRKLDKEKLTPRNVNKHRQVLHSIFRYGMRADTYALPSNPVAGSDKRPEPAAASLDFYEPAEVEALARACEEGKHRGARGRARDDHEGPEKPSPLTRAQQQAQRDERAARAAEDAQDADLFRVLFYSGLRLGEALALRWGDVQFLADMTGAVLHVHRAVSAGVEKTTKTGRDRHVPVPRPAAEALARRGARGEFTADDDYVFCNRLGRRLDDSAVRRRYRKAAEAAKLRHVKLHGLRHAAGSILARSVPLVTVRDVLGHAKLSTTNRYLHSKVDAAAVAAVNAAFGTPVEQEEEATAAADDDR